VIASAGGSGAKGARGAATPDTRVMCAAGSAREMRPIANDLDNLTRWLRLARSVLLCMTVLLAPGCIIPVELQAEREPENSAPVIANLQAVPPFGYITHNFGEPFELSVPVDDADLDDNLTARIFKPVPTGTGRVSIGNLPSLAPAGDLEHPERRAATFPFAPWCDLTAENRGDQVQLSVVVTDSGFQDDFSDKTNGPTDEAFWVLTCN
jgi:hypothetical protein